jgi:spermidine synthase
LTAGASSRGAQPPPAAELLAALSQLALYGIAIFLAGGHLHDFTGRTFAPPLCAGVALAGLALGAWLGRDPRESERRRAWRRALLATAAGWGAAVVGLAWPAALGVAGVGGLAAGPELTLVLLAVRARRRGGEPFLYPEGFPRLHLWAALLGPVAILALAGVLDAVRGALLAGVLGGFWGLARTGRLEKPRPEDRVAMGAAAFPVLALAVVTLHLAPLVLGLLSAPLLAWRARAFGGVVAAVALWNLCGWTLAGRGASGAPPTRHFRVVRAAEVGSARLRAQLVIHRQTGARQVRARGLEVFTDLYSTRVAEALVHPAMAHAARRGRVLLVGGECSGIPRELAKYGELQSLDVVRLQPGLDHFCRSIPAVDALLGPGLVAQTRRLEGLEQVVLEIAGGSAKYDVVLVMGPHPPAVPARLFSGAFLSDLAAVLDRGGVLAARLGGFNTRNAAYCAYSRLRERFTSLIPYHVYLGIPAGPEQQLFALAADTPLRSEDARFPVATRSVYPELFRSWTHFPPSVRFDRIPEPKAGCASLIAWRPP